MSEPEENITWSSSGTSTGTTWTSTAYTTWGTPERVEAWFKAVLNRVESLQEHIRQLEARLDERGQ